MWTDSMSLTIFVVRGLGPERRIGTGKMVSFLESVSDGLVGIGHWAH